MERNTLLAIVLSALVLFSYQAIFVAPKQQEILKNSQVLEKQSVSATNTPLATIPANNNTKTTNSVNKTEDYELKTTEQNISFTKVGGSLHNIDFIGNNLFPITDLLTIGGLENSQYTGQKFDNQEVS